METIGRCPLFAHPGQHNPMVVKLQLFAPLPYSSSPIHFRFAAQDAYTLQQHYQLPTIILGCQLHGLSLLPQNNLRMTSRRNSL
jgi:hypothetical protein